MAASNENGLRAVRTFADDSRRARGEAPLPTPEAKQSPAQAIHANATPDFNQGTFRTLEDGQLDISSGDSGDATIVSEHQVKSWSFTQAAANSLSAWWKDTLAEIRNDLPQKKVSPASSRLDIIRAASVNAKLAPQDDRKALVRKLASADTPVPPPQKSVEAIVVPSTPQWTHEATPAQPEPQPQTAPEPRERLVSMAQAPVAPPSTEFRAASSAPIDVPRVDSQAQLVAPERTTERVTKTVDAPRETSKGSSDFVVKATEAARKRKEQEEGGASNSGSPFIVYLGLFIVAAFIFALIATLGYVLLKREQAAAPEVDSGMNSGRSFFVVTDSLPVVLTNDRTELLNDLTRRVQETGGIPGSFIHFYFVYASDAEDTALPAHAFIDTLRLQAPGSFLRTIKNDMMFGVRIGAPNAPFLVLTVKNYEEALGGMLAWERSLNTDLAPLFGEDIGALGYAPLFTDAVAAGRDVRVLKNADGQVISVHGFVDQSTIVITTSLEAFIALAQALE